MSYLPHKITLAEYILDSDREQLDYKNHCEENNLHPFDLRTREPSHILESAAQVMIDAGYDLEGWLYK